MKLDLLVRGGTVIDGSGGDLSVRVRGVDYTGERFYEVEGQVSIREFLSLSEDISAAVSRGKRAAASAQSTKVAICLPAGAVLSAAGSQRLASSNRR